MKSKKVVKEVIKTEKLPQGKTNVNEIKKNKTGYGSNVYTVKETTVEKTVKKSYNTQGGTSTSNKSEKKIFSSNLKQGTNSGVNSQNKIPVSNKEENNSTKFGARAKYTKFNYSERFKNQKKYSKAEIDKIIKIQRWWKRILAILEGYKIREKLRAQNKNNYTVKSKNVYTEQYMSRYSSNQPVIQNLKYSNLQYNSSFNNLMNTNSRSYTNINDISTSIKKNFNTTSNLNTSSSQKFIQTIDKRIITQNSPRLVQSVSTSPSVKSRYIIETKKVEVFQKPKNYSANKFIKQNGYNAMNSISNYEVRQIMRDIWNDETFCSTVESLCCLGDDVRHNTSQNSLIFEEYEEEIRKLKTLLMEKDDELNNLMANLKETRNQLNVNISKDIRVKSDYNQKKFDPDAHELQIITKKIGWNDINVPSPVNEIFIESIENQFPQKMQYIEGMQVFGKRQEESIQESITDPEAVLEIQEMNALSIISNRIKPKNLCQHLQSLMILAKREEQSEEYSVNLKEKKTEIEAIPVEKEPLVFQKIEQINITSIRPKKRKIRNQIQELDGLEIINYSRPKIDLKRKTKPKMIVQNVDKINIKSLLKKEEKKNIIQELDGLEIIKTGKEPHIPQSVDELEIPREYDMLLVKPTWNSLTLERSGLNLLAMPREDGLENEEIDEFAILGLEKPELEIENLEKFSFIKPQILQKVQVLIPIPENKIKNIENFKINGIKKEPEVIEKIIVKDAKKKVIPNRIDKSESFQIKGIKKEEKVVEKIVEKVIIKNEHKKVISNSIEYLDEIAINGKEKDDYKKIIKGEKFSIRGKPKTIKREETEKEEIQKEVIEVEQGPEDYIEESVVEISILIKPKKKVQNEIKAVDSFNINGLEKIKEELKIEQKEFVPVKRKGFAEKINKTVIKKKEEKKEEPKLELYPESLDCIFLQKSYQTKKEDIIIHEFYGLNVGKTSGIKIEGETKIVKDLNKNWNDEIKPIKTTKLNVKGEKIEIQKQKEEFNIESFSINIGDDGKKFRGSFYISNEGFDLEGNKGMILKEGPAQIIKINKELPSKIINENRLFIKGKPRKIQQVGDVIEEVETTKTINWNDFNILRNENNFNFIHNPKKEIESKIVEVNKNIDWNKVNKIENKRFNLITKKVKTILESQRTNSIKIIDAIVSVEKNSIVLEKIVVKDWKNTLQAQRNAKFALLGKQKTKKYKLLVANGDKFFIQKESDDEIIYNDDYNSRQDNPQLKKRDEGEQKAKIIKEKEIVPRLQREIRAQISRLKESESESSSISDIDVLASIRKKKIIGASSNILENEAALLKYKKEINGYNAKIIGGEVVFTAKNGLGVNLGGTQYQKQIHSKLGYTKKFSNKMSGIEIINPKYRNEVFYQKLVGSKGAIEDGNYKIIDASKSLSGSVSCRQMRVLNNSNLNNSNNDADIGSNGQEQSYRKQIIISSRSENITDKNEINGQPDPNINVILNNSRTKDSKNSLRKKDSQNSGNNNLSPNNRAYFRVKDSPNSVNNNYDINQKLNAGKVVFNSKLKTDNSQEQNSPNSVEGKTRNQIEIRIKTSKDGNEKVITETKKTTEIRFKKTNSKTKNVEPLRDYDSQSGF